MPCFPAEEIHILLLNLNNKPGKRCEIQEKGWIAKMKRNNNDWLSVYLTSVIGTETMV